MKGYKSSGLIYIDIPEIYDITKTYICSYCGAHQSEENEVWALLLECNELGPISGTPKYACDRCIEKGVVPGFS